jgi:hypothetical protein
LPKYLTLNTIGCYSVLKERAQERFLKLHGPKLFIYYFLSRRFKGYLLRTWMDIFIPCSYEIKKTILLRIIKGIKPVEMPNKLHQKPLTSVTSKVLERKIHSY